MVSEGLRDAFSILKLRREILWIGQGDGVPPKEIGDLVSKIQFVTIDQLAEHLNTGKIRTDYLGLVISITDFKNLPVEPLI